MPSAEQSRDMGERVPAEITSHGGGRHGAGLDAEKQRWEQERGAETGREGHRTGTGAVGRPRCTTAAGGVWRQHGLSRPACGAGDRALPATGARCRLCRPPRMVEPAGANPASTRLCHASPGTHPLYNSKARPAVHSLLQTQPPLGRCKGRALAQPSGSPRELPPTRAGGRGTKPGAHTLDQGLSTRTAPSPQRYIARAPRDLTCTSTCVG